jgi:hypothetical protein
VVVVAEEEVGDGLAGALAAAAAQDGNLVHRQAGEHPAPAQMRGRHNLHPADGQVVPVQMLGRHNLRLADGQPELLQPGHHNHNPPADGQVVPVQMPGHHNPRPAVGPLGLHLQPGHPNRLALDGSQLLPAVGPVLQVLPQVGNKVQVPTPGRHLLAAVVGKKEDRLMDGNLVHHQQRGHLLAHPIAEGVGSNH